MLSTAGGQGFVDYLYEVISVTEAAGSSTRLDAAADALTESGVNLEVNPVHVWSNCGQQTQKRGQPSKKCGHIETFSFGMMGLVNRCSIRLSYRGSLTWVPSYQRLGSIAIDGSLGGCSSRSSRP